MGFNYSAHFFPINLDDFDLVHFAMASNVIPVRIAHGWAIAWLDLYQTPAVVTESVTSSIKVFFFDV